MFKKSLFFAIFFAFIISLTGNTAFALTSNDGFFAPENTKLQKRIADKTISCARNFVSRFNKKSGSKIVIRDTFYDKKFHRVYLEIDGTVLLARSIHKLFVKGEKIYSSDGKVAFDFVLKDPVARGKKIAYKIQGELIIFQENLILSIAHLTPGVNLAFTSVGETVLKILEESKARYLANIAAETLMNFSPESLEDLKIELKKRADSMGDTNLEKFLFLADKTAYFTQFFALNFVNSIPGKIGEYFGSSIGSTVGSLLMPGPGTLTGAYLGALISGQIVSAIQYRIPVNFKLIRMKMLAKLSNNGEIDNFASRKFNVIRKKLNREVRKDLDEHSYIVVNEILDALEKIKEDNRKLFEIIAKDLKEILLHQLVHEKDRYAARKLKQLQSL